MGHLCPFDHCKRRTGERGATGRVGGGQARAAILDAKGKPAGKRPHATPHAKGAAVDRYFDGLSYRRAAGNREQHFGRETGQMAVYRRAQERTGKAKDILGPLQVNAGSTRVADEIVVKGGGQNYWLFKTDGRRSCRQALPRAFPTRPVKHTVSQGIKAEINNNFSERLQGTIRDRDKTLRGLKGRDTGQAYIDGLALHYNYFRPPEALDGKRPAQAAGAEIPFQDWGEGAAGRQHPAIL